MTNRTCKGEIVVDQIQAPKFVASSNTDIFLLSSIKVNDIKRRRHQLHRILKGKIEIISKVLTDGVLDGKNYTLSLIYTPGVAYVAQEISGDNSLAYEYIQME